MIRVLYVLVLFSAGVPAAEVWRCPQADGTLSFQQAACDGERVETGEAQATWASLRGEEARLYEGYRKRDRERLERQRRAERRALAARAPSRAAETTCYKRKVALENVQAKLRVGYKPAEGDRLRRRRGQLEEYLRRFCR